MEQERALRVAERLRKRGLDAHLERASIYQFGVRIMLRDGRQAIWDTGGTIGLQAQVMRDGVLVGYVPQLEGSEDFDEEQTVVAIAATDYDSPVAAPRTQAVDSPTSPPAGVLRRFIGGLRE